MRNGFGCGAGEGGNSDARSDARDVETHESLFWAGQHFHCPARNSLVSDCWRALLMRVGCLLLSAGFRFGGIGRACGCGIGRRGWQVVLVSRLVLGSRCWFASTAVAGEACALAFPQGGWGVLFCAARRC